MNATIYWATQHLRRTVCRLGFAARLWWLNRQVEFLDWRLQLETLLPPPRLAPAPQPIRQGSRHAIQPCSVLHGSRTPIRL
jgi:hypothetical protein